MLDIQYSMCLNPVTFTLLMSVTLREIGILEDMKRVKVFEGKHFEPKKEYHISIINKPVGLAIKEISSEEPSILNSFLDLINNTDWSGIRSQYEYCHVVKDKQKPSQVGEIVSDPPETIIVGVTVPAIEGFYNKLSDLTGIIIETPYYPHVTLYLYKSEHGIRVSNKKEFDNYVRRKISLDELHSVNP